MSQLMNCQLLGIGAWGPGFNSWDELKALLLSDSTSESLTAVTPKPEIIPANERRRSPLPVKIAVETSWQASQAANISPEKLACVFGSGLGDTQITDYMCNVLTTELKQLSPTKFHNSVHNAAAGYWTISTDCMQSANSIAAYHETTGLAILEAASQCVLQNDLVLVTLFDDKAHSHYQEIFPCNQAFSAAIIIAPENFNHNGPSQKLSIELSHGKCEHRALQNNALEGLYEHNPAAKILSVLELVAQESPLATQIPVSADTHLTLQISP